MKLEQQVTSLELSKKLKELGVEQKSFFYWTRDFEQDVLEEEYQHWYLVYHENGVNQDAIKRGICISAFTVAELGEMLPVRVKKDKELFSFRQLKTKKKQWDLKLRSGMRKDKNGKILPKVIHEVIMDKEADARAKMLIYLYEKNLITNS